MAAALALFLRIFTLSPSLKLRVFLNGDYGEVVSRTGATSTPFLFCGAFGVQADANGLSYMRARYYSPESWRFLNADPTGFAGGMNLYAYVSGNPVCFVDPHGEGSEYPGGHLCTGANQK